jgi:hypothetical protein
VCLRESLTHSPPGASIAGVRVNTLDVTPACPGRGLREKPASARKRGRFSIVYASPPRLPVIPCLTPSPTRLRDPRVEKPSTKHDPLRPQMTIVRKASASFSVCHLTILIFHLSAKSEWLSTKGFETSMHITLCASPSPLCSEMENENRQMTYGK